MHFDPDENIPLCDQCCLQKKKGKKIESFIYFIISSLFTNLKFLFTFSGSYCPLCEMCYDDNDYDAKMMECAQCGTCKI